MIAANIDLLTFAQTWLTAILRASWQGAIVIVLVWCLCRFARSLPPAVRCWLWRLALIKMCLIALWPATIDLPWLPGPRATASQADLGAGSYTAADDGYSLPTPAAQQSPSAAVVSAPVQAVDRRMLLYCTLWAVWGMGVATLAIVLLIRMQAARRWRKQCVLVKDAQILTLCERLADELGVSQPPLLMVGESCESPVVFGALRTCVVLPARLVDQADPKRLRLVLRHELAHIRRGDLIWNWMATAIWGLFFFHPLVWIALRELRLTQELASDACAVAAPESSVADYGNMLVELAEYNRLPSNMLVTVGVVESFEFLKRRLRAMKDLGTYSRWVKPVSVCVLTLGLAGLLPWRLVAAPSEQRGASAAGAEETSEDAANQDRGTEVRKQSPAKHEDLAVTSAGKYKISVENAHWVQSKGLMMTDTGFPFGGPFHTEEASNEGPGYAAHAAASAGGSGFGGKFSYPNLVLDLRVEQPGNNRAQLLCALVGKIQAKDNLNNQLDAPQSEAWVKIELPGVIYPRGSGQTAVHLFAPDKEAKSIKTLAGELMVADAKIQSTTFEGRDLDKAVTRKLDNATVRLNAVDSTDDGVNVQVGISPPPQASGEEREDSSRDPIEAMRNFQDTHARLRVVLEDSDGQIHYPQGVNAGGGGVFTSTSSGGSVLAAGSGSSRGSERSFSYSSRSGQPQDTSSQECHFAPLPQGVEVKKITCIVTDLLGKPQRIAFKFRDLPLP